MSILFILYEKWGRRERCQKEQQQTTDDNGIRYFVSANQNQLYINIPKAISSAEFAQSISEQNIEDVSKEIFPGILSFWKRKYFKVILKKSLISIHDESRSYQGRDFSVQMALNKKFVQNLNGYCEIKS